MKKTFAMFLALLALCVSLFSCTPPKDTGDEKIPKSQPVSQESEEQKNGEQDNQKKSSPIQNAGEDKTQGFGELIPLS